MVKPNFTQGHVFLVENHLQWELDRTDDDAECKISGFSLSLFNSDSDKMSQSGDPWSQSTVTRGEVVHESKLSKDDRK